MRVFSTEPQILSVSQLNNYLKDLVERDTFLSSVAVKGEISNYKKYPSGHHYFSLKDANGVVMCVMFRASAQHLRFQPENGMQVIAFGKVSVYTHDGKYQLYVDLMTAAGVGDLYVAFEQLKQKLDAQGLFSSSHKKPVPIMPDRIALITSGSGAAVRDMIRVLGTRWPMTKVLLMAVRVQGAAAPAELVSAVRYANRHKVADLIIIGRGGGSIEDLWAFNDESLARAIYDSELPVISAVGHEPDFTISDFVADVRAATPSNGAELAVPDQNDIREKLNQLCSRMSGAMRTRIVAERKNLERLSTGSVLNAPDHMLRDKQLLLDRRQDQLCIAMEHNISARRQRLTGLCASLDSLSPLKVLSRGYGLVQDIGGKVITSVKQTREGQSVRLTMSDGYLSCTVTERSEK